MTIFVPCKVWLRKQFDAMNKDLRSAVYYQKPAILQEFSIEMEAAILAGSVADKTSVETTGQEVEEYDFGTDGFNHTWGE